jgi:leucyl-tRNA synthetase
MVVKDGAKMSKSLGNIVDPDDMIQKYGADTVRIFMLFAAPVQKDLDWSDEGIEGSFRFLNRLWRYVYEALPKLENLEIRKPGLELISGSSRELLIKVQRTIRKVTSDLERFQFNTAIAAIMELLNATSHHDSSNKEDLLVLRESLEAIIQLIYPMAPHIAEELWESLGYRDSLVTKPWLKWNEEIINSAAITIVVQVNGRVRSQIIMDPDSSEDDIKRAAMSDERVKSYISGKEVRKIIVVPKKLVNMVI